jgi:hypothetical protein
MFRENISPSGDNRDAIRAALVELMYLSHRCFVSTDPNEDFKLDVMHYIFNEMHDAMVSKRTPPYAPYIMLLINQKAQDMDFSKGNSEHKLKRMNVIKPIEEKEAVKGKGKKPVPSGGVDVEMGDSSSRLHKTSSARPSRNKKLSLWQRTLLCINVAIHKENYFAYEEKRDIIHNQQVLSREVQLLQDPSLQLSPIPAPKYIPYERWQDDNGVDWAEVEALSKVGSDEEFSGCDEDDEDAADDDEDEFDDE